MVNNGSPAKPDPNVVSITIVSNLATGETAVNTSEGFTNRAIILGLLELAKSTFYPPVLPDHEHAPPKPRLVTPGEGF